MPLRLLCLLCFSVISDRAFAQYFSQNFDTSTTTSSYSSASPHSGQFSFISSGVSISEAELKISKNGASCGFCRNANFTPAPTGLKISFDIHAATLSGATQDKAATLYIGSGFSANTNTEASYYSRIAFSILAGGQGFKLTSYTPAISSSSFSGTQTVTLYLNKTGVTTMYTGPDNLPHYITTNVMQAWVGASLVFDSIQVSNASIALQNFKLIFNSGSGDIFIDNMLIAGNTNGTLPVELTSFTVKKQGRVHVVSWQTATEHNFAGFALEKSENSIDWLETAFIPGSGNSNTTKNYRYDDYTEKSGAYKYRLKEVDNDGTFRYSKTIAADGETGLAFRLEQNYPNPCNPGTTFRYYLPRSSAIRLSVYTVTGELCSTLQEGFEAAGHHELHYDAGNLSSGCYFIELQGDGVILRQKMLVLH